MAASSKSNKHFFDSPIILNGLSSLGILSTILSLCLIPYSEFVAANQWIFWVIVAALIPLSYLCAFLFVNCRKRVHFKINGTPIAVGFGDLLKEEGPVVVSFNEYFDTDVSDNEIIDSASLNGQYLLKNYPNGTADLDQRIQVFGVERKLSSLGPFPNRKGKKSVFPLGCIFFDRPHNSYLLAFSRFDENERVMLKSSEYISCLVVMWENISKISNRSVSLPVIGSGFTTNFENCVLEPQECLFALLSSFRLSGTKNQGITIILPKDKKNDFDLYTIKRIFNKEG